MEQAGKNLSNHQIYRFVNQGPALVEACGMIEGGIIPYKFCLVKKFSFPVAAAFTLSYIYQHTIRVSFSHFQQGIVKAVASEGRAAAYNKINNFAISADGLYAVQLLYIVPELFTF
jgi:hypothetical protein